MRQLLSLCLLLFLLPATQAKAVELSDSSFVSLLTYDPNEEVHAMYGHTAIRVCDSIQGIDYVFNYGTFDFNSPNFVYRFVKGETDYILSASSYEETFFNSVMRNIAIHEQTLNLTRNERNRLWDALRVNLEPQNRGYRYNFLFDNCTTRAELMIKRAIDGTVCYVKEEPNTTFRRLLNHCTAPDPWLTFGEDLILGGRIDQPVTFEERLFLPHYLYKAFETARIQAADGTVRPLVERDEEILGADPIEYELFPVSPCIAGLILLVGTALLSLYGYRKRRLFRGFDLVFYTLYGAAGCIVWFLVFVSQHPAVSPNWNALWLQPGHLLFVLAMYLPIVRKRIQWYHLLVVISVAAFYLIRLFTVQQFNPCLDLFVVPLWLRSASQIFVAKSGLSETSNR